MIAEVHTIYNDLPSDKPILVPDGQYSVSYVQHATWLFKGRHPKIVLTFAIQDFGEHHLKLVHAYYNASKLQGKPKKGGHFSAGWNSDFMFDYSTCFETPTRKDRISMCRFKGVLVKAKTRTVTHNRDQRKYPEGMQYSVIDRLEGIIKI